MGRKEGGDGEEGGGGIWVASGNEGDVRQLLG